MNVFSCHSLNKKDNSKKMKRNLLKRSLSILYRLYNISKLHFATIIILGILTALLPTINIYIIQIFLNRLYDNSSSNFEGYILIICYLFVAILFSIVSFISTYIFKKYSYLVEKNLTISILKDLNLLSLERFENAGIHNKIRRVFTNSIPNYIVTFSIVVNLFVSIIIFVSSVIYVEVIQNWVGIILGILPFLFLKNYNRITDIEYSINLKQTTCEKEKWYVGFLLTQDSAFKENRVFNFSNFIITKYKNNINRLLKDEDKLCLYRLKLLLLPEILLSVVVVLSMLYGIYTNEYSHQIGYIISFIQLSNKIFDSSKNIINNLISLKSNDLFVNEYVQLEEFLQDVASENKEKNVENFMVKSISLDGVTYRNDDGEKLLDNITLDLSSNQIYFIVGSNGSGKSTFLKVLAKLYNKVEGNYYINNDKAKIFTDQDILKQTSFLFQDFKQYEFSLNDNIAIGDVFKNNIENIYELRKQLNILEDIENIELGTWFESGRNLSGGEAQKVAIARALYKDASLLLLDEPDSMLDIKNAEKAFNLIRKYANNKIVCVVTHNIDQLRPNDNIIFIENRKLIATGKHYELLRSNEKYSRFWN